MALAFASDDCRPWWSVNALCRCRESDEGSARKGSLARPIDRRDNRSPVVEQRRTLRQRGPRHRQAFHIHDQSRRAFHVRFTPKSVHVQCNLRPFHRPPLRDSIVFSETFNLLGHAVPYLVAFIVTTFLQRFCCPSGPGHRSASVERLKVTSKHFNRFFFSREPHTLSPTVHPPARICHVL